MSDGIDEMLKHVRENDTVESIFGSQQIPVEAVEIGLNDPVHPHTSLPDELRIQFYPAADALREFRGCQRGSTAEERLVNQFATLDVVGDKGFVPLPPLTRVK